MGVGFVRGCEENHSVEREIKMEAVCWGRERERDSWAIVLLYESVYDNTN